MSVTVTAVPFLLLYALGPLFLAGGAAAKTVVDIKNTFNNKDDSVHLDNSSIDAIVNRTYNTNIMDENALIKTLEEHGAQKIEVNNSDITCVCDVFRLNFTKQGTNKPYALEILSRTNNYSEDLLQDINKEYCANAQEISYNKIKERLEQKNLKIEDEEVYDDDTIVLTVNLEEY